MELSSTTEVYNLSEDISTWFARGGDSGGGGEEEEEEIEDDYSLGVQITAGVIIVVLTACNIIGNTCTLLAFWQDPKLRTPHNCYIANLAVTDLTVGFISVPFYAVYTIRTYYWQFGYVFCKVWCVVDFLVCAESALNIALISFDRFLLVKDGALYNTKHTRQGAVTKIAISWVLSFLLYGPAIISFDIWRGHSTVDEDDCDVEFATDFWYTLVSAIIEFLVPATLLIVFNVYIFWKIRQRALGKVAREKAAANKGKGKAAGQGHTNGAFSLGANGGKTGNGTASKTGQESFSTDEVEVEVEVEHGQEVEQQQQQQQQHQKKPQSSDDFKQNGTAHETNGKLPESTVSLPPNKQDVSAPQEKRESAADRNMRRYRKAARSLALLVVAFSICWVPYTVSTLILSVCDTCVDQDLFEAFNWLLWLNSSINPFLYAATNPLFKQHYKRLLCSWSFSARSRKKLYQSRGGDGSTIEPSDTATP